MAHLPAFYLLVVAGSLITSAILGQSVYAQVYKYTDNAGNVYFVDSPEKIPEVYKNTSRSSESFPSIGRVPAQKIRPRTSSSIAVGTSKRVELFVTSWCPYCRDLEAYMHKRNIRFTRYDIESSPTGAKLHQQLGGGGVPVARIGGKVVRGFDVKAIDAALK